MLGDTQTGKSSICARLIKGEFSDHQEPTVGAAFFTQTVLIKDYAIKFEVWDTAGQERYYSLSPMYYRRAAVAIVVYDITSSESFRRAKLWVKEIQTLGSKGAVIALVGNKIDKEQEREIAVADAKQYANANQLYFIETSAKMNINVRELFVALARQLPKVLLCILCERIMPKYNSISTQESTIYDDDGGSVQDENSYQCEQNQKTGLLTLFGNAYNGWKERRK